MALSIVRHDITKIKAEAIVNSTNQHFVVGGLGVDASIHFAAGPQLQTALDEIGSCPVGSAVITDSFNIPTCKYIIHAVAPVRRASDSKGKLQEKKLLYRTYYSVLKLAYEKRCKSVAVPLLSAGDNGFSIKEAYEIATFSIRGWLSRHYASEMEIILVLYDRDATDLSQAVDHSIQSYITDKYTDAHKEALKGFYEYPNYPVMYRRDQAVMEAIHFGSAAGNIPSQVGPAQLNSVYSIEHYADVDLSFAEMCEWWCDKKKIKKGEFFSASNITRATFSNMKQHPDRAPKKNTVMACAIGLRLDIDQAKDLLMRAGMIFSKHYPTDRLVEQCIRNKKYNIDEINLALYEMDLMGLGYSRGGE